VLSAPAISVVEGDGRKVELAAVQLAMSATHPKQSARISQGKIPFNGAGRPGQELRKSAFVKQFPSSVSERNIRAIF
jgi:hypothetical protein